MTTIVLTAVVTAYVATGHPCANGKMPAVGHTVAIPRGLPLGTRVLINGHWYVGEDRTAKKFDGRIDIFMASKREAVLWGKQTLTVTISK